MHIYEPKPKRRYKSVRRVRRQRMLVGMTLLVLVGLAGGLLYRHKKVGTLGVSDQQSKNILATSTQARFISGHQFQSLFEQTAHPNTARISVAPSITGNAKLDERIVRIAESRGYHLQAVPQQGSLSLSELESGTLVQAPMLEPLHNLLADAAEHRIPLRIEQTYQSIDAQRELFKTRLGEAGITNERAANGEQDVELLNVLETIAPPGYSRLHTGYGVRFVCERSPNDFESSPCHAWLSNQNYANTKKYGFIPSFAENVGIKPAKNEAEYVWIGTAKLQ